MALSFVVYLFMRNPKLYFAYMCKLSVPRKLNMCVKPMAEPIMDNLYHLYAVLYLCVIDNSCIVGAYRLEVHWKTFVVQLCLF